jgi:hypothetical protein
MKGGPAVPGGPLKSKPTGLNMIGFNPAGFFAVARAAEAADGSRGTKGPDGGTIMKVQLALLWTCVGIGGWGMLGCDVSMGGRARQDRVYVDAQPQYVQPGVYEEPQPQYVIVREAPPPVLIERRPAPPSEAYVWIDGYWNWDNQRYSWQAGRYVVPPQADVAWVAPRYDRDAQGYRYTPGTWAKQGQGNGRGRRGN